jgi:hypothetical protein
MEQDVRPKSAVVVRLLKRFTPDDAASVGPDDFVFDAPGAEAIAAECAGIVLATGDEARAAALLSIGAPLVFVGEAALRDSGVVTRLVAAHGRERIGIYAPVKRQTISWSFETVSNADFKTVTPSHCEPAWEVLMADGAPTGTLAAWWLTALRDLGATQFLVQVLIDDDTDLNLCADLVERLGDSLWMGPRAETGVAVDDWVRYGQVRRLVLPEALAPQLEALTETTGETA